MTEEKRTEEEQGRGLLDAINKLEDQWTSAGHLVPPVETERSAGLRRLTGKDLGVEEERLTEEEWRARQAQDGGAA